MKGNTENVNGNAIMTYKEYMNLYASDEFIQSVGGREAFDAAIDKHERREKMRIVMKTIEGGVVFVLSAALLVGIFTMITKLI